MRTFQYEKSRPSNRGIFPLLSMSPTDHKTG
uniref:Uncharacterized protein n=1 Tax=Arundo donax TaxID=35708 RepID=A0A0A8YJ23_ARUDO